MLWFPRKLLAFRGNERAHELQLKNSKRHLSDIFVLRFGFILFERTTKKLYLSTKFLMNHFN